MEEMMKWLDENKSIDDLNSMKLPPGMDDIKELAKTLPGVQERSLKDGKIGTESMPDLSKLTSLLGNLGGKKKT